MKLRTKIVALTAALVAGPLATGIALAGTPSADNTITACVASNGTPRIIDKEAGATCATGERQISWSAGWRIRGTYDATKTYQVGDVVSRVNTCGGYQAPRLRGTETWVKVAPGPETATPERPCPAAATWVHLSRMPDYLFPPDFPETYRVPATADNLLLFPADGGGAGVRVWNYGDIVWIQPTGTTPDVSKCVVTGTAVTHLPYFLTRLPANYAGWIGLYVRTHSGTPSRVPVEVTLFCPETP